MIENLRDQADRLLAETVRTYMRTFWTLMLLAQAALVAGLVEPRAAVLAVAGAVYACSRLPRAHRQLAERMYRDAAAAALLGRTPVPPTKLSLPSSTAPLVTAVLVLIVFIDDASSAYTDALCASMGLIICAGVVYGHRRSLREQMYVHLLQARVAAAERRGE